MAQTKAAIQCLTLAHRKNASGRGNPSVADYQPAIVQRRFWVKNAQHQLNRKIGIERHASFFVNANGSVTFNRKQRAELFVGQLSYRLS